MNNIWRFKGNNFTSENGLNNSDMEMFKKDPIASLARETCQNSIDAKRSECTKSIVEFKSFTIAKEDIPGIERLEREINSCYEYRKHPKDKEELRSMQDALSKREIRCLRISDYNTIGLKDVFGTDESSKFYLLTKGSGITDKTGNTGGSKGIGKFASFVASAFNTVYYSTVNIKGEKGYLGISKLCSAPCIDNPEEKTIGIGYYSSDDRNSPIEGEIELDPAYHRTEPGTDIYILGFKSAENWVNKIVTMILDSFMCAIIYEELEVRIDDIVINKDTVKDVVYSDKILKNHIKNVKAQYELLTEEGIYSDILNINDMGTVKVLLKAYNREEIDNATKSCVMVRYPYMKIKSLTKISSVPCSAMCIIEKGILNERLISVENPQHNDWETNRLDKAMKAEMDYQIKTLERKICEFVAEKLSLGNEDQSDIEGAGEFLPSNANGNFGEQKKAPVEKVKVMPKSRSKVKAENPIAESNSGEEGDRPDIGDFDDVGDDTAKPHGENNGHGGAPHPSDEYTGHNSNGDKEILVTSPLTGMKYVPFIPDKTTGEIIISFTSLYDSDNCEMELNYQDESGKSYPLGLKSGTLNGQEVEVKNNRLAGFNIIKDQFYRVSAMTDIKDYYRIKVTIYESKK